MHNVQDILTNGTIIRERYAIKSLIGTSSSGAVYQVVDLYVQGVSQKIFALKEIAGLEQQERYQCTFTGVALQHIDHPTLPHIHHVFNEDKRQRIYAVMDYIEGPDLETLWQQQPTQRFTWPEVIKIMTPIFKAVRYLHQQKKPIVHGDIKPINILLAQPENAFMLVDFSITKAQKPGSNRLLHTASYKAPEQYEKNPDRRADIYGFAATCYALVTSIAPINALARQAHIKQGLADPLRPASTLAPAIPVSVSQALHRAMSISPGERFSTIEEFWQALQAPSSEVKLIAKPVVSPETPIPESIKFQREPVLTKQSTLRQSIKGFLLEASPGNKLKSILPIAKADRRASSAVSIPSRNQHMNLGDTRSTFRKYTIPFIMLMLLMLVGASIGIWSLTQSYPTTQLRTSHVAPTPSVQSTQPLKGTGPIATPTSSPGTYPSVVGSYTGTLVDLSKTVSTTIILQGVHQVGGKMSGYLTSGSSLKINGPFNGTIDTSKHLQFTIVDTVGHPLFFFEGAMQTSTSLSGDFYQCNASTQEDVCVRARSGYGIWNALIVPPNS